MLKTIFNLLVLFAATFAAGAAQSTNRQAFAIGCSSADFASIHEAIDQIKLAGGDVIELEYGQALTRGSPSRLTAQLPNEELVALQKRLRDAGLRAWSLAAAVADDREQIKGVFELARKLQTQAVVVRPSGDETLWQPRPERPPAEWRGGPLDSLGRLADEHDMLAGVINAPKGEGVSNLWRPEFLTSLFSNRSVRLGVSFDLENAEGAGIPALVALKQVEHRLVSCYVTGPLAEKPVLVELKRQGFKGALMVKRPAGATHEAIAKVIELIKIRGAEAAMAGLLEAEKDVKVIDGFKYEILSHGELSEPMDLEFSPEGTLWVTGRRGELWARSLSKWTLAGKLTLDYSDDRGLHGIEFDPGFITNGFVFLFYSPVLTDGFGNRLSRFTIATNGEPRLMLESEKVLLEFRTDKLGQHNGGAIAYNPIDGKLYVSTGDNNNIPDLARYFDDPNNKAQNLMDLRGKVLRLNLDGSIPSDNPFAHQLGKRGEIYTLGHRQPYTIQVDETVGDVYVGENGGDRPEDFEEINRLVAGGNYGWPRCIGENLGTYGGPCAITNAVKPWFMYQRFTGASCQVGPFYRASDGPSAFPSKYENGLFYADYNRKWLRFVKLDAREGKVKSEPFARGFAGGPLAIQCGPDGALYIVEYGAWMRGSSRDRVSRIVYTRPPSG